jgi:Thymidylate synthase complementing protein
MSTARVIADSVSAWGRRLTTIEVTLHRFVLAEFNTHRKFSRNSASSRAIPLNRQIERIHADTAYPIVWTSEQSGMQGGLPLSEEDSAEARLIWAGARNMAIKHALELQSLGVHKSISNRLIEPFAYHTIIASATTWEHFWAQRCSPLAQPEIREAAEVMYDVYKASTPKLLELGEWHLPYVLPDEFDDIDTAKKVGVARCARVSYLTHDGKRDPVQDLMLFERLVTATPPHASPLEHVATPYDPWQLVLPGNFNGWAQFRHEALDGY